MTTNEIKYFLSSLQLFLSLLSTTCFLVVARLS